MSSSQANPESASISRAAPESTEHGIEYEQENLGGKEESKNDGGRGKSSGFRFNALREAQSYEASKSTLRHEMTSQAGSCSDAENASASSLKLMQQFTRDRSRSERRYHADKKAKEEETVSSRNKIDYSSESVASAVKRMGNLITKKTEYSWQVAGDEIALGGKVTQRATRSNTSFGFQEFLAE